MKLTKSAQANVRLMHFPFQNGLKQGYAFFFAIAFQPLFRICHWEDLRHPTASGTGWVKSNPITGLDRP
jgi:hypothetical protein